MNDEDLKLAEVMCARLCHDLAGPVGAVGTGAELLADEDMGGELAADALELLATSAATAVHRLRFLRLALGVGGSALSSAQLRDLVTAFLTSPGSGGEGMRLDWRDDGQGAWDNGAAKLLLNMVLLARDSLPRGGAVVVSARASEGAQLQVSAEGGGAVAGEAAVAVAALGVDGLGPRGAQGYYAARLARSLGLCLEYRAAPGRVEFYVS